MLLRETVAALLAGPGKVFLDATVGYGGHAAALLDAGGPEARLIGMDKDPRAIEGARQSLGQYGDRVMLIHEDFRNAASRLDALGVATVDGVLADLGVSSPQFDEGERGFSFRSDAPLDMRMNPNSPTTAWHLVNQTPTDELADLLWNYGEERFSRRIAAKIDEVRQRKPIERTMELASLVFYAVPPFYRHRRIHPATRTFQALRIAVNQELEALREFLDAVPSRLSEGGRLAVISFHSLEDRIVKERFRALDREEKGRVVTKKPLIAEDDEISRNPRSRSAKLRVFEQGKASKE